jgi:hypothetical protein
MSKDEAIHKALKVLNCLNNDRVYETAWVKGAINACEEALEQPQPRLFLDLSNSNGNHPVNSPEQECKWCKSREVNFDDWGDEASEKRQDVVGQNGPTGEHYQENNDGNAN